MGNQTKSYPLLENSYGQKGIFNRKKGLKSNHPGYNYEIGLSYLFQKLLSGLWKIMIAIKYWFFRVLSGWVNRASFPWLKLGLVFLVFFMLTRKDIQFSFNLKAPLEQSTEKSVAIPTKNKADEMSILQSVGFGNEKEAEQFKIPKLRDLKDAEVKSYIKRFKKVAVAESKKFNIPASVKLAQGILESHAGTHDLAQKSNNHYGLVFKDKNFQSAWECWRAHSVVLQQTYPGLVELGGNYKKWAADLKKHGYCNDKHYDKKLIGLIEKYHLHLLDETENFN